MASWMVLVVTVIFCFDLLSISTAFLHFGRLSSSHTHRNQILNDCHASISKNHMTELYARPKEKDKGGRNSKMNEEEAMLLKELLTDLVHSQDVDFFRQLLNDNNMGSKGSSSGSHNNNHSGKKMTSKADDSNSNTDTTDVPVMSEIDLDQMKQTKLLNSVIRVYCTHSSPNYNMPWQRNKQDFSSSTGFVLSNKQILTNAHAVEYGSLIQVKKRQSENKYVASVIAIGHECDLAVLTVEDDDFWKDLPEPLEFGELPDLFEDVSVVGYPIGGDSVSITSGVVSRIEMQEYVQASAQLLAIQIDAAINPGNSGGPVVNNENQVIGVAFQSLSSEETENIGYVIPVPVIHHFLDDVGKNGRFSGVCGLGVRMQGMENEVLRKYHGMQKDDTGVMIAAIAPLSPARNILQVNDVLLSVRDGDNNNNNDSGSSNSERASMNNSGNNKNDSNSVMNDIKIANDATIPFREGSMYKERVQLSYYFSQKFPKDIVQFQILRNHSRQNVSIALSVPQYLVHHTLLKNNVIDVANNIGTGTNGSIVGGVPSYLVIGGLVFVVLSQEYLHAEFSVEHMDDFVAWADEFRLLALTSHPISEVGEEVVLLSQVIAHSCNIGYERSRNMQLVKLNGHDIENLKQLKSLLYSTAAAAVSEHKDSGNISDSTSISSNNAYGENLLFEFKGGQQIVLNRAAAMQAQTQICKEHFIPSPHSRDLLQ